MRGHPNEPRILMVPHRVLAVVLPRYPAQEVPEILLKSFTYNASNPITQMPSWAAKSSLGAALKL